MKTDAFSLKKAYTCKRKRDYITVLGVILFFGVVLFELYLVFWVPVQIKSHGTLEGEVAKQEMINLLDDVRNDIGNVKTEGRIQDGELNLARNVLDSIATYVRENQERMSKSQIKDTYNMVQSYRSLVQNWKEGKFLIKEERLDYSNYIRSLEEKAGMKASASSKN